MQSNRTRIRKEYAPLTVAQSIVCMTPASGAAQVYNGTLNEWEPDRELTPTTILPDITAAAADGSWPNPRANAYLADMHWFVNGQDITTLPDWAGKYTIEQNGDNRGAITISRNISPGEVAELHFEAVLADNRLGVNIPIVTDRIPLVTTEKAGDGYSVSLTDGNLIEYDPMKDRLALYDYRVAQGEIIPAVIARQNCIDHCSFEHRIPFTVMQGTAPLTTGYTARLYEITSGGKLGANGNLRLMTSGQQELQSMTANEIVLDLRLISKASYVLKIFVKNVEVASVEFGVSRIYQKFKISPTNGTGIHHTDIERYDRAMVDCDGNVVVHPGRILKIDWFSDTDAKKGVQHNEGEETVFLLAKTGIGDTYADNWCEVYCEAEYKPEHKTATDSGGSDIWTDADGNTYIFN